MTHHVHGRNADDAGDTCTREHNGTACGRPLQGGTVCPLCMSDWATEVDTISALLDDIETTVARQSRTSSSSGAGGKPGSRPPVDLAALEDRDRLVAVVATWCRAARVPGILAGPTCLSGCRHDSCARITERTDAWQIPSTSAAATAWLARQHHRIRAAAWVLEMLTDFDQALTAARRRIDRPDSRVRVLCPSCGERVSLQEDPDQVTRCRGCGAWGVHTWWVEHAAPPTEPTTLTKLPLALYALGWVISERKIRDWADRRLIHEAGRDSRGRRLFDPTAVALTAGRLAAKKRRTHQSGSTS